MSHFHYYLDCIWVLPLLTSLEMKWVKLEKSSLFIRKVKSSFPPIPPNKDGWKNSPHWIPKVCVCGGGCPRNQIYRKENQSYRKENQSYRKEIPEICHEVDFIKLTSLFAPSTIIHEQINNFRRKNACMIKLKWDPHNVIQ